MIKPEIPNMPGMASMADAFEFMKKMWGGASMPTTGLPGMVMPTLSVEEINKQIADLKAVEAWLNVNMNMLRGTIQALEVQSATLSTLQAMGQSFSAAMTPEKTQKKEAPPTKDKAPANDEKKQARAGVKNGESPHGDEEKSGKKNALPDSADFMQPMANPAVWWNMLQNQFNQAVGSALEEEPSDSKGKPAAGAASARRRKAPPPVA
ncbi:MAG: hypothetical protein K0S28_1192 [Paucimonas sp.]|jgi:hypothetical protein|nr:hypothetical protein [Paucimonas sp.]